MTPQNDLDRLKALVGEQVTKAGTAEKKYNPNQPRDPAGSPTGGQWTSSGGAAQHPHDAMEARQAASVNAWRAEEADRERRALSAIAAGKTGESGSKGPSRRIFPGDSNQSQAAWRGKDGTWYRAWYRLYEDKPFIVDTGKPFSHAQSSFGQGDNVVSSGDIDWDYTKRAQFGEAKEAAAYMKEQYGIEWDGEFEYSRPPRANVRDIQIGQAVARGDLTPAGAAARRGRRR